MQEELMYSDHGEKFVTMTLGVPLKSSIKV